MKSRENKKEHTGEVKGMHIALSVISFAFLPIYLVYGEVLFRVLISEQMPSYALVPGILFALGYGLLFSILTALIPNRVVTRILRAVLMLIPAILFLLEYYIFRAFKMLYDVNTITNAALDVIGSNFMSIGAGLIFSATGLIVLFAYLLPIILYAVFCRKIDLCPRVNFRKVCYLFGILIYIFGGAFLSVANYPTYNDTYKDAYQFTSAVDYYGLMTAFRLEIRNKIGGEDNLQFADATGFAEVSEETTEETSTEVSGKKEESTEEKNAEGATETKKEYGENALDLDFDKLMEEAPNETIRSMDEYVSTLKPSKQNEYTGMFEGKNLILITAEAFTAEAIDPDITPTLYRMSTKGINFTDYYQPSSAGTTGGEVQNIFGVLPLSGGSSMNQLAQHENPQLISQYLNDLGYYGEAYHNNDYMYYDRHITHNKLGYSEGYIGRGNGMEEYLTNVWPESDLEMIEGTVDRYIDEDHFDIYYMTVSGHSLYSWSQDAMARKNQDAVKKLEGQYSEPVLAYLAANVELDRAMEYLINRLEEEGKADDTVIVISADHFPYGLDSDSPLGRQPYLSELYGEQPMNYIERDHNRLIMWCGELEENDPIVVDSPTSSLDILPTLLNLYGLPYDSRLYVGRDVFSNAEALMFDSAYDWKTDRGTYIASSRQFTPTEEGDEVPDAYIERINLIVKNKMNYMRGLFGQDYYKHVLE